MPLTDAEAVFSLLDREIWLLTAGLGDRRAGLICTLVSQASIVPDGPRVWVGLSPQHHTTGLIRDVQSFVLHLLHASQFDLAWRFGTQSGHIEDKFAGGDWQRSSLGHPQLPETLASLECAVESCVETGDRLFFLAKVLHAEKRSEEPPMTLNSFRRMLSPTQAIELRRRLVRDAWVDADLIRRWNDAGYRPLAISNNT